MNDQTNEMNEPLVSLEDQLRNAAEALDLNDNQDVVIEEPKESLEKKHGTDGDGTKEDDKSQDKAGNAATKAANKAEAKPAEKRPMAPKEKSHQ